MLSSRPTRIRSLVSPSTRCSSRNRAAFWVCHVVYDSGYETPDEFFDSDDMDCVNSL